MKTQTTTLTSDIQTVYIARRDRLTNPAGKFDNAGRWYPTAAEDCGVSATLRSPSRAYPYSYMVGCRTRKHVAALAAQSPAFFAAELVKAQAAIARRDATEVKVAA